MSGSSNARKPRSWVFNSFLPWLIAHRRKCRHNQQKPKKKMTPAQNIHLSSFVLLSIIRIVSPETPSVFATE